MSLIKVFFDNGLPCGERLDHRATGPARGPPQHSDR